METPSAAEEESLPSLDNGLRREPSKRSSRRRRGRRGDGNRNLAVGPASPETVELAVNPEESQAETVSVPEDALAAHEAAQYPPAQSDIQQEESLATTAARQPPFIPFAHLNVTGEETADEREARPESTPRKHPQRPPRPRPSTDYIDWVEPQAPLELSEAETAEESPAESQADAAPLEPAPAPIPSEQGGEPVGTGRTEDAIAEAPPIDIRPQATGIEAQAQQPAFDSPPPQESPSSPDLAGSAQATLGEETAPTAQPEVEAAAEADASADEEPPQDGETAESKLAGEAEPPREGRRLPNRRRNRSRRRPAKEAGNAEDTGSEADIEPEDKDGTSPSEFGVEEGGE